MLLPDCVPPVEVDPSFCLTFDAASYPASSFYEGGIKFNKHYYLTPWQMNGEEAECAAVIDAMEEVQYWVRNIEREDCSFWLPTSTDRFYPDFVAQLRDGRILVVEYKSEREWSTDDSREKRAIGELWAEQSKGRCLFVMPKGRDWNAITGAIGR